MNKRVLITGSEGFIGSVARSYFESLGYTVFGIDNLSRCFKSFSCIKDANTIIGDICDSNIFKRLPVVDVVIHLAAQVSVIEGDINPDLDFNINARGTFNVVQWAKKINAKIIYASTNKVFGDLIGVNSPIKDSQPLNPKTNYGVSKCTGAIYVNDFGGHILHQSCIYGETQHGDINQGWVGWLRQCRDKGMPVTCFGDGTQIRDLLHVNDLVRLYRMCVEEIVPIGQYVVGGGAENMFSFAEAVDMFGINYLMTKDHWVCKTLSHN